MHGQTQFTEQKPLLGRKIQENEDFPDLGMNISGRREQKGNSASELEKKGGKREVVKKSRYRI